MRAQTGNCSAPPNAIVAENCQTGTLQDTWDVGVNGDDPSIVGFATDISYNVGQTASFKINTSAKGYSIDVYRIGYYNGRGARKITSITPSVPLPQSQPACLTDATTNLVDCGKWAVSAQWQIPATAVSGIYFLLLTRGDNGGQNHIIFIVRNDSSTSDLVFQTADESWQAYNEWQPSSTVVGHSLYGPTGSFDITNRAYKVSYNRPFHTRDFESEALSFVFGPEYAMVRWLEENGYDVSYVSGLDAERNGSLLLKHKIFLSVGHDEYVSGNQRTNIEAARDAGVNLAFFSGNETFWKTRWEPSIDGSNTPNRTLVCYKETYANAVIDPADPPTWTGTFRDPRFSPPGDGGNPENALHGTLFMVNGPGSDNMSLSIKVPQADGRMRFWRNTSIAALAAGATATLPAGTLGYEWDEDVDNGFRPAGLFHLSTATYPLTTDLLLDYGETYGSGNATHNMTLYKAASGALVFGAGTVQWSFGLDGTHDDPLDLNTATDIRMQQATVNLLADMGVQPGTLQSGLVTATPSADSAPPTSTITSPAGGASVHSGDVVTITGTAADSGGGVVGGVEVSYDGGASWHPAIGRESWSYQWSVRAAGKVVLKSRAVDDSGNIEIPKPGNSITVAPQTCPCTIWGSSVIPGSPDSGDGNAIEAGVAFTAQQDGYVSGIRFYKSAANKGVHVGNLWSSGGVLLGSATFASESASGWQQVNFPNPVAITANTTYIASYFAPGGHYSADTSYFATSDVSNPPLDALSNTTTPNGLFSYNSVSTFPTSSFSGTNYWVDVVYTPTGTAASGPAVVSTNPPNSASGVSVSLSIKATFNEAMNASTINTGTFFLSPSGQAGSKIPATVTYASGVATLTAAQPLAYSTTYTADIVSGANGVADTNGNYLAADASWSFTTSAPPGVCPCSLWTNTTTPATVDGGDGASIEVGLKFRSDENGYITGIRFYKSTANTGTHVADLWTSTGIHLASATFSGESASGWQQVNFSTPVPVTANTTYIASYLAPAGHYSANSGFFTTAGVDVTPLHGLANNADGPNGVYVYTSTSSFPTSTYNSANYWVDVVFNPGAGPGAAPSVASVTPAAGAGSVAVSTPVSAVFSESMDPSTVTAATFQLVDGSNNLIPASVSYNPATLTAVLTPSQPLSGATTYSATIAGGASGVKDAGGDTMNSSFSWTFTTVGATTPGVCPCSIWGASTTPTVIDSGDATAGEYGGVFYSDTAGYVAGIRFYKSVANTGTHLGHLWSNAGALLASAQFTSETSTGWQQLSFSSPVYIAANTPYIVSYYAPNGHYSDSPGYFASIGVDNSPLHSPASGVDGSNGLFNYGPSSFPTSTYNATNYWVDVVFTTTPSNGVGPAVVSVSPASGSATASAGISVTATFNETVDPSTINASTFQLLGPSGAVVPATVSYNQATMTATLSPASQLAPLTSYTAVLTGAPASPRIQDLGGLPLAATYRWSFSTVATAGCPCSLWPQAAVPSLVDSGDGTSGEFGMKFTSDQNGYITGIRFYRTLANTGAHIANLWTEGGVLLATAPFTSETKSGWQQVNFANPVAITANTTYVASYFTPNGHYSADPGYFANSAYNNTPLHALQNGADGGNGVFAAGDVSAFPSSTFNSANYWVDVVFTTAAGGTVAPTVTAVSPGDGATGVSIGTNVTVTFDEVIDRTTLTASTFFVTDSSGKQVPASISYNAATATLVLTSELGPQTTYTATLIGGSGGIRDLSGNALAANVSWAFTTGNVPANSGPGGPILVVTSAANPFTSYLGEILQTEGLNEFTLSDIANVSASTLSSYDIVLLGDMSLTASQVSMFTSFVNAGGNLIAMHPDPQLASLLGLSDVQAGLSDAYLQVNTSSGPGVGIVNQAIQFHGNAELYSLNGASSLATLYSNATTATASPAVTLFSSGAGQAAAFTYDLARSVVYTRQGNPAWSGQIRDGLNPIRSDDLFIGAAAGDPQPDWVDRTNIAIPQADEQQRLLANLILQMNQAKKPLPRFWYFPLGYKGAVVMTGDDHGGGGTTGRFNTYVADSPQNCSVANWQCIRATAYLSSNNPITNTQAAAAVAQGFEVAMLANTTPECSNYSPSSLATNYASSLAAWTAAYPSVPAPTTVRMNCVVWSDYDTQPQVEASHGIRMDTNYYYYPANWVNDQPGFFTGSGMPMRFATLNGSIVNVYQAATQLTDASGQTYPFEINSLLANATGPLGYYGVFTADMSNDTATSAGSDAIVAAAQSYGVPVISALQMRQWLDGRNASSFNGLSWNAGTLTFSVSAGTNTTGIQVMLPMQASNGTLLSITQNGTSVSFGSTTVKGVAYGVFQATSGSYQATYGQAPQVNVSPASLTFGSQNAGTSSASQTITVANTGVNGLTIASIGLTGTNSADFTQTNTCGTSLASGGSCTIAVTFAPTAAGSRSASVAINDNAGGSPQMVSLSGTANASPAVNLSSASLTFPSQTVGTSSASQAITLSNTGAGALAITSISVAGSNSADFTLTNTCGTSVAAGASCSIAVNFKPSAAGLRSAAVTVNDNAAGSPHSVSLSGTGVTAAAVSLSPSSLTFASQVVGTSSASQTVTLSNTGGSALAISSIVVTGTNTGDFIQTNTCATSIAAGATCSIAVRFAPTAAGSRTASITIADNAATSPQTIALSGTAAAAAAVSVSPTSLTFASQIVATSSASQTVTLSNTGGSSLAISSIGVAGTSAGDFSQTNTCGTSVAAGGKCTIAVKFTPTAAGSRTAVLTIADNAIGTPQTVALSGSGTTAAAISLSPSSLTFASQSVGTTSAAQTITLSNTGGTTLSLSVISVTGTNNGDFSQSNTCSASVPVGATCRITVTFKPSAAGSRTAAIQISSNAAGSPASVNLTGTGLGAVASLSPASVTFATTQIGSKSAGTSVTLTNAGNASMTISSISIAGTNSSDFSQTNDCTTTLAAAAHCTIVVAFSPKAPGSRSASLTVSSNATGGTQGIPLSGGGTAISISPSTLDFGSQKSRTTGAAQTITVRNVGSSLITVSGVAISGTNRLSFSETTTCSVFLFAGSSCTVSVKFSPTQTGSQSATLALTDSDPTSPQSVSLSGVGN